MSKWDKLFRIFILIAGIAAIVFDVELYNAFEQQKTALSSIRDKQDAEAEFNSNKFKYQSDQIERITKDLEDAQEQIKDQKDALSDQKDDLAAEKDALTAQKDAFLQEVEKRQEIENQDKALQKSLVDITAEADAIKHDMQNWQKDYVTVLAEIERKTDYSEAEIKSIEDNLTALDIPDLKKDVSALQAEIDKINHPPVADTKIERTQVQS